MIAVVYVLCAAASLMVAGLLWRGYQRSRARLLYWSALCFVGFGVNNILLVVDTRLVPMIDLAIVRLIPALLGALALVYGLIIDAE